MRRQDYRTLWQKGSGDGRRKQRNLCYIVALTPYNKDPRSLMAYCIEPKISTAMTVSMAIGLIGLSNTTSALLSNRNFESGVKKYAVKNRFRRKRVITDRIYKP